MAAATDTDAAEEATLRVFAAAGHDALLVPEADGVRLVHTRDD